MSSLCPSCRAQWSGIGFYGLPLVERLEFGGLVISKRRCQCGAVLTKVEKR